MLIGRKALGTRIPFRNGMNFKDVILLIPEQKTGSLALLLMDRVAGENKEQTGNRIGQGHEHMVSP